MKKKIQKESSAEDLAATVRAQRKRIDELEKQVDYLRKRFVAAKQAVKWFETKFRFKWQDSYGT